MGDIYISPLAYDEVAAMEGEEVAQKLWEKNGGTGKYVPGAKAISGWNIEQHPPLRGGRTGRLQ